MTEKMDFAGGKYTVVNDNGKLTALRYGEPWGRDEDLVGDNLVHSMLVDSLRLKAQRDVLLEALKRMASIIDKMGDMPDGFIHPSPWRELKCEEALAQARAAIKQAEENT